MSTDDQSETLESKIQRAAHFDTRNSDIELGATIKLPPIDGDLTEGITYSEADAAPPGTGVQATDASKYALEELIGQGGMGFVYRARQEGLNRPVAFKTAPPNVGGRANSRRRSFVAEAAVTSSLEHPNIIPVHELGEGEDGQTFFTMKLLEGRGWDRMLSGEAALPPSAASDPLEAHLDILLDVTNAVAFAHRRGFLHRDIKPENVLVGDYGEVVLTDWGIAARLDADGDPRVPHAAETKSMIGTPAYFAPELALGEGERQGPWTDVFGLGGILYEILTGERPNAGPQLHQAITAACNGQRVFDVEGITPELIAVCQKALAPAPADRFKDALAFRDALLSCRRNGESNRLYAAAERARIASADSADFASTAASQRRGHDDERHQALALYQGALEIWPDNAAAHQGLASLRGEWAEDAERRGDLSLAVDLLNARNAEGDEERVANLDREIIRRQQQQRNNRRLKLALAGLLALAAIGMAVAFFFVDRARQEAVTERENYDRLAILSEAGLLIDQAENEFWPPALADVAAMDSWMIKAEELLAHRPILEDLLESIRARSPYELVPHSGEEVRLRRVENLEFKIQICDWHIAECENELNGTPPPSEERADELRAFIDQLERESDQLELELQSIRAALTERRYDYALGPDLFRARTLEETLTTLDRLKDFTIEKPGSIVSIPQRRAETRRIQQLVSRAEVDERWEDALAVLTREPHYLGTRLKRRDDLIPLSRVTDAGMLRFALLGSDPLRVDLDQFDQSYPGIVLILLPEGTTHTGNYGKKGLSLYEPADRDVPLLAFFLGETEVTGPQFEWVIGKNHSRFSTRSAKEGNSRPMDSVSYLEAEALAHRLGGTIPTGLRLEYAAREGREVNWPNDGSGIECLNGLANLSDQSARSLSAPQDPQQLFVDWKDGWKKTSDVRAFAPTYWGFHGLWGNVAEWTRDYGSTETRMFPWSKPGRLIHYNTRSATDGENRYPTTSELREVWGGSYSDYPIPYSLPYHRRSARVSDGNRIIGVRLAAEL